MSEGGVCGHHWCHVSLKQVIFVCFQSGVAKHSEAYDCDFTYCT